MDPTDVDAYLDRIGHAGPREPTPETLRALHRAHLASVPFENVDIHIGRRIRLDPRALFRKVVEERRGGFCYELNGLFALLLGALGFDVTLLSARVAHDTGGFGPEHDHLALLVASKGRWLADVGFGRAFREPLSLDAPTEDEAEGLFYRALEGTDGWRVESRAAGDAAKPEYAFTLSPQRLEAFASMCVWHQTSPESHFTRNLVCTRATARGRATLSGRKLVVTEGDERLETPLPDEAAVTTVLAECFGVRLPEGATLALASSNT